MFSFFFLYLECSPDAVGPPGGPRPKNQDGGVKVIVLHIIDTNLSVNPQLPVDVAHNCSPAPC